MGGTVKKAKERVEQALEDASSSAEGALDLGVSFFGGPVAQGSKLFDTLTGEKTGAVFRPNAVIAKESGEMFVDKPKAAKEAQKEADRQAEALRQRTMNEVKKRRRQEGAESAAASALDRARRAQSRRRRGTGRGSTILTGKLGDVGGTNYQGRKSLLGL